MSAGWDWTAATWEQCLCTAGAAAEIAQSSNSLGMHTDVAHQIAPTANPEDDAGGFEGTVITAEEAADDHRSDVVDADGVLALTAAALGSVPIEQLVVEGTGNAGTAICARAAESAFDLIVVGSHGRGFIARAFMGSVSSYIVSHAPCPVLVVRAHDS